MIEKAWQSIHVSLGKRSLLSGVSSTKAFQWILAAVIFSLPFIPQLYKFTFPFKELFCGFMPDDAFYYYKTAINIKSGLGSTFDTINITNGYHPLWMAICVLLAFITTDINAFLYVVLTVNFLFVILFSFQVYKMFKPILGTYFAYFLICMINWNYTTSNILFSGLEIPLYLLLLFILIQTLSVGSIKNRTYLVFVGSLAGMTFLARTEFVLFLPILGGILLYRLFKKETIGIYSLLIYLVLPFLVLTVPYLVWNYETMGYIQQISGRLKLLYGIAAHQEHSILYTLAFYGKRMLQSIAFVPLFAPLGVSQLKYCLFNMLPVTILLYCIIVLIRSKRIFRYPAINILLIYSVLTMLFYFFAYGTMGRSWHIGVSLITLQIIIAFGLSNAYYGWGKVGRYGVRGIMAIFAIIFLLQVPYYRNVFQNYNYNHMVPVYYKHEMAKWIRENLPETATIAISSAGYIGYFSKRKVINIDGLINGNEFYNYLREKKTPYEYVLDKKIDYLVSWGYGPPEMMDSLLGPKISLAHNVRRYDFMLNGKKTYADMYLWKIHSDE